MKKSLKEISWQVSEDTYRKDEAVSYSMLAKFSREGPLSILSKDTLDTPSLRFGSLLDCLVTAPEEFEDRFVVFDYSPPSETVQKIIKDIQKNTESVDIALVEDLDIIQVCNKYKYGATWKDTTRISKIKEEGNEFFKLLVLSNTKTVINSEEYKQAVECCEALKTSEFTSKYFTTPIFEDVELLWQLKFKSNHLELPTRCMFDKQ